MAEPYWRYRARADGASMPRPVLPCYPILEAPAALPSPTPYHPFINSSEFLHKDNLVSQPGGVRPESGFSGYSAGESVKGYPSNLDDPCIPSHVLFVDGLPGDCSRREVAHIFRPLFGFKDIKGLHKEPRTRGEKPMVLCC